MNIIASTSKQPYTEFVANSLNKIEPYTVKGIAIVVLTDSENMTGYWNMELVDKIQAKTEIEFDCMDGFILANKDRYINDASEAGSE